MKTSSPQTEREKRVGIWIRVSTDLQVKGRDPGAPRAARAALRRGTLLARSTEAIKLIRWGRFGGSGGVLSGSGGSSASVFLRIFESRPISEKRVKTESLSLRQISD